jgi:hypothetical protein
MQPSATRRRYSTVNGTDRYKCIEKAHGAKLRNKKWAVADESKMSNTTNHPGSRWWGMECLATTHFP